uniref:Uncharacterized protein n=1 Tax=Callorhinchus milii TaxID=7868 RepID=A0A4W3I558_CALMI
MRVGVGGAAACFLFTLSGWPPARAKYDSGTVETDEKWVFLTKFCFLATKGQINYHIRYPQEKYNVNLLFYHDEKSQWPSVYKNRSKDCWSKEAVAAIEKNQLFNLTQSFPLSGCQVMEENGINYTDCQRGLGFKSARERWWFLAVSNCMGGGIRLDYKITMTNGKTLWRRHFSVYHILCFSGRLLHVISYLLLLMDPGKVQTGLESPFGFAVTALQFLTALWFSYSTYHILQQHPEKQPFYSYFFPAFTFWFFVVPFSNILGQFIIVPWKRERIMNTVFLFLKFYAYVFLVRPFHSNSRFPYHIDTSRIALMRHGLDSQGNFEKLGHHLYRNISVTSFINSDSAAPSLSNNTDLSHSAPTSNSGAYFNIVKPFEMSSQYERCYIVTICCINVNLCQWLGMRLQHFVLTGASSNTQFTTI